MKIAVLAVTAERMPEHYSAGQPALGNKSRARSAAEPSTRAGIEETIVPIAEPERIVGRPERRAGLESRSERPPKLSKQQ